jgi:DNA-binding NarL/FixJ family response regulator
MWPIFGGWSPMVLISTAKVLIANNHNLFREGLHHLLQNEKDVEIVGDAMNGAQMISAINDLKPDIVLHDIKIPGMDTVQILSVIKSKGIKSLVITTHTDDDTIIAALKAGASGYLSVNTTTRELAKAIRAVHRGEMWVERKMVAKIIEEGVEKELDQKEKINTKKDQLTPREQEVLALLTEGYTNKEIANKLFISEKTVKSHMNNIFKRLNVTGRLQAIVYAIKHGLC